MLKTFNGYKVRKLSSKEFEKRIKEGRIQIGGLGVPEGVRILKQSGGFVWFI